jgi:hypothetical protein
MKDILERGVVNKLLTGAARDWSRPRRRAGAALVVLLAALVLGGAAQGAERTKLVHYRGLTLRVPASWPVYSLARAPSTCVRFDRHAVYLGTPGPSQDCPAHAAGRTEAILVVPRLSATSDAAPPAAAAPAAGSSEAQLSVHGLHIIATWRGRPDVIARALGVRTLGAGVANARRSARRPHHLRVHPAIASRGRQTPPSPPATAGGVYTGLGFDACHAPSETQMSAWSASPYRAIGVYIGGANEACSQPNLTPTWAADQATAGWHLIPIYVGLQAPENTCGCAAITPSGAASQGAAAATDAVAQAQALGLGTGNPIYDDMEAYPVDKKDTTAVLAFLNAWTQQLHASGYMSGVYSSLNSGISDLVNQFGSTTFTEPDELWIADWDGRQATTNYVPATAWANHQLLHQYSGAHNERYGGVQLSIDGDYLDSATAAPGSTAPRLVVAPAADGSIALQPSWPYGPAVSSWQVLAGPSPTALTSAGSFSASTPGGIVIHSAFQYFQVQALDASGTPLAASPTVATPAHLAVFGGTVFVSAQGLDAFPVGCFNSAPCHVSARISVGGRTVTTGREYVPVGGGMLYFSPSGAIRRLVLGARRHQLPATIKVRDSSGIQTSKSVNLKGFFTTGPGPKRILNIQSPSIKLIGLTDFVSNGWVGGILAECAAPTPCSVQTTLTIGHLVIAQTRPAYLGVGELGYMLFTLTRTGHRLLSQAKGNQLLARATLWNGSDRTTGRIALVSFS